ncbi:MAG: hypothetical protein COY80_00160 [Candidatus Pacebacteria bacterium CG_4_10_14_0_8_um_filter_42_14]|nr:MAG: hypothetical protein COY80_00160 [Candidatus Pacebacteria bacterium CG_4_10_14_0_8_um_filter_42_14]
MPRFRSYHLHLPHLQVDRQKDLLVLYFIRVARDFVNQTTFFFMPIFLYMTGQQLLEGLSFVSTPLEAGFLVIAGYYLIARLVMMLTGIPLGSWSRQVGLQRAFIFSDLLRSLMFALFFFVSFQPWILLVAAVVDGLQANLFWNNYYTVLSRHAHKHNVGKDLGLLQTILQIASALAPALGGILAAVFGFNTLFLFALAASIFSIIIVFKLSVKVIHDAVSYKEFFTWLKEPRFERLAFSFVGQYINDATLFLWPLYVFLVLGAVDKVGYLYTASLSMALIFSFLIGVYVDGHKSKKPFVASGGMLSLLWLARTQIATIWGIAVVDMVEKLTSNFHWLFFESTVLRRSKGNQAFSYFVYREIIRSAMALIFWLAVFVLFLFTSSWTALFILAAMAVLFSLLITDKSHPGKV